MSNKTIFRLNDWERYAECYDSLNHLKPYKQLLEQVALHIPVDSKKVLDAACGTGNLENKLPVLMRQRKTEFYGVDASTEMLSRASKKNGKQHNMFFLLTDLNQPLPFDDAYFDCVVSVNTLYAINSPLTLLKEFTTICRFLI